MASLVSISFANSCTSGTRITILRLFFSSVIAPRAFATGVSLDAHLAPRVAIAGLPAPTRLRRFRMQLGAPCQNAPLARHQQFVRTTHRETFHNLIFSTLTHLSFQRVTPFLLFSFTNKK